MGRYITEKGYGICISKFADKLTYENLYELSKLDDDSETSKKFYYTLEAYRNYMLRKGNVLADNGIADEDFSNMLGYNSAAEVAASGICNMISDKYNIYLIADQDMDGDYYVVFPARYPWERITDNSGNTTKEGLKSIFESYTEAAFGVKLDNELFTIWDIINVR